MSRKVIANLEIRYDAELAKSLTVEAFLAFNEFMGKESRHYREPLSAEDITEATDINSILVLFAAYYLELEYDGCRLANTVNVDGTPSINPTTILNFYVENEGLIDTFYSTIRILTTRFGFGIKGTINMERDYAWEIKSDMHSKEFFVYSLERIVAPRLEDLESIEKRYKALELFLSAEPERPHSAKTLSVLLALAKVE